MSHSEEPTWYLSNNSLNHNEKEGLETSTQWIKNSLDDYLIWEIKEVFRQQLLCIPKAIKEMEWKMMEQDELGWKGN